MVSIITGALNSVQNKSHDIVLVLIFSSVSSRNHITLTHTCEKWFSHNDDTRDGPIPRSCYLTVSIFDCVFVRLRPVDFLSAVGLRR